MKKNLALDSFDKYFGEITEPRKSRGRLHKLRDIMIIGVLSVICGADDFTEMEEFGNSKASFLKDYLELGCTNEQKKFPVFLSCETIKKNRESVQRPV